MLVTYSDCHPVDAKMFRACFPFCPLKFYKIMGNSFFIDLSMFSGSHMDIVAWYVSDFCSEYVQNIEFEYGDSFTSISVVYANGRVTFNFFNHE